MKELLENALDAGATRITLAIKDGGKQLIRVTDNGCGMSAQDASLCIGKHATSKITCIDDLSTIGTFGFRGEALAALAAVSRMTIITKEASTHEGTKLTIERGEIIKKEPVAAQTGTTIEVCDLFYNVPARQKFLKKRETEFRHIQQLFNAMCFAHPTVQGTFYSEDVVLAQYAPAKDLFERCTQLLKPAAHNTLLSLAAEDKAIRVSGALSDHQWFRYDRTGIFLFVNKRWIKNQHLARALIRGYTNVIPQGRFPVACVMLEVASSDVDVNVHPRKEEVQFVHARRVENVVRDAVKTTLEENLSALVRSATTQSASAPYATSFPTSLAWQTPVVPLLAPKEFTTGAMHIASSDTGSLPFNASTEKPEMSVATCMPVQQRTDEHEFMLIGQLHKTYLLAQTDEGLLLVDQHAAHERVLYELFARRLDDVATVQLLFPELVTLTSDDWATLEPHMSLLKENGIAIEPFGNNQVRITATPVHLKHASMEDLVRHMIGLIHEHKAFDVQELANILHKKVRAQMACKAAVKAGDVLSERQMHDLLTDLHNANNRLTCPHGRPTCWRLSQHEIEKKFKRVT